LQLGRVIPDAPVALRLRGQWVGVCRAGADEHRSTGRFETCQQAILEARRMAALIERQLIDD